MTDEMALPQTAPGWARDQVLTELRRSFPEPLSQGELQKTTGLGTGDLRAVVAELVGEEWLEDSSAGFVLTEVGYDPETAPLGQPMGAAIESEPEEPEVDPAPEAVEGPEELPGEALGDDPGETRGIPEGETRYSATLAVEVGFYPELLDGEAEDAGAVREGKEFAKIVMADLKTRYPSLPVGVELIRLEAFDNPRQII